MTLRVDVVTGPDAAKLPPAFHQTCTDTGGTVQPGTSPGAVVCKLNGAIVDGELANSSRVVSVELVNADTATATQLTPAFGKILAAVR
jgi:hypothetical protein